MLAGDARQLAHTVQVLESIGKCLAPFGVQHFLHGDFLAGLVAHGLDKVRVLAGKIVGGAVFIHQGVNFRIGHGVHRVHQLSHGPSVDLPAELCLHFDLVALGHGDLAHIVAETHDLQFSRVRHAHGGTHPVAQALLHVLVLPVARNDLAGHPQAGGDKAVLAGRRGRPGSDS